jgi:hypothetical protein
VKISLIISTFVRQEQLNSELSGLKAFAGFYCRLECRSSFSKASESLQRLSKPQQVQQARFRIGVRESRLIKWRRIFRKGKDLDDRSFVRLPRLLSFLFFLPFSKKKPETTQNQHTNAICNSRKRKETKPGTAGANSARREERETRGCKSSTSSAALRIRYRVPRTYSARELIIHAMQSKAGGLDNDHSNNPEIEERERDEEEARESSAYTQSEAN